MGKRKPERLKQQTEGHYLPGGRSGDADDGSLPRPDLKGKCEFHKPIDRRVILGNNTSMAKLTLHVTEHLVSVAKSEAAARRVSVSKLVSDFFAFLASTRNDSEPNLNRLAPRTRRLAGCIPKADFEEYIHYLERKHS